MILTAKLCNTDRAWNPAGSPSNLAIETPRGCPTAFAQQSSAGRACCGCVRSMHCCAEGVRVLTLRKAGRAHWGKRCHEGRAARKERRGRWMWNEVLAESHPKWDINDELLRWGRVASRWVWLSKVKVNLHTLVCLVLFTLESRLLCPANLP